MPLIRPNASLKHPAHMGANHKKPRPTVKGTTSIPFRKWLMGHSHPKSGLHIHGEKQPHGVQEDYSYLHNKKVGP